MVIDYNKIHLQLDRHNSILSAFISSAYIREKNFMNFLDFGLYTLFRTPCAETALTHV